MSMQMSISRCLPLHCLLKDDMLVWCLAQCCPRAFLPLLISSAPTKLPNIEPSEKKLKSNDTPRRQHSDPRPLDRHSSQQPPRLDHDPRLPRLLPPRRLPHLPHNRLPPPQRRCALESSLAKHNLPPPRHPHPHLRRNHHREPRPPQQSRHPRRLTHPRCSRQPEDRRALPTPGVSVGHADRHV